MSSIKNLSSKEVINFYIIDYYNSYKCLFQLLWRWRVGWFN